MQQEDQETPEAFRERAAKARRHAKTMLDDEMYRRLMELATELDMLADRS